MTLLVTEDLAGSAYVAVMYCRCVLHGAMCDLPYGFFFLIFVVPSIMLYIGEISPTRCNNCVFIRNGFTLHVSGDNLTHHQEYNAVYGYR